MNQKDQTDDSVASECAAHIRQMPPHVRADLGRAEAHVRKPVQGWEDYWRNIYSEASAQAEGKADYSLLCEKAAQRGYRPPTIDEQLCFGADFIFRLRGLPWVKLDSSF